MKIHVAIAADEFDLLFSPEAQGRLRSLGRLEFGVEVPGDNSSDVLVTSWSTQPFPPERLGLADRPLLTTDRPPVATDGPGLASGRPPLATDSLGLAGDRPLLETGRPPDLLAGGRLRLAVHSAGSVRRLFPRETLEAGLRVCQAGAAAMAPAVAELALTLTLALLRNLHHHDRTLWTTGDWREARQPVLGRSLAGRSVGIVGLGRAGRHYAQMVQALGAQAVRAYDPFSAGAQGVELVGLAELFAASDVIAVHAPSTPQTHHLIGRKQLSALPDGAVVINTARSWVVDQDALLEELVSGRLLAGLDVFDEEPLAASSPFLRLPNVIVTPHVAGGTFEARRTQGDIVVDELARFERGEPLQHEVTLDRYDQLA
ncbi:MAG TPA: NAD(P)-dependent oxidoreductase [Candidatus Limnocylindrales bacterium]